MKKLLPLLVLLLTSTLALGQGVNPNLDRGSAALLFTFDGFSTLRAGSFEGGVGAKYYLSPKMALRGSLLFANASADIPVNPPAGQTGQDGEQSATQFGVSAALELHLNSKRASPYLGGGIGFSTTSTETKSPVIGASTNQVIVENDDVGEVVNGVTYLGGNAFSVFALAGVEFFLFNEVSLGAEYRLGIDKLSRADQKVTSGSQTQTTKVGGGSNLGITNRGLLTLSVYF